MNFHSPAAQAELKAYNEAMEQSLEDKLFFLDHTAGAMTFVDFGCANGVMLKALSERRKAKTLIGIDINEVQLGLAAQKVPNGVFVQDFSLVRELIERSPGPRVAIFSSVLHESPSILADPILSGLFDYIVIRDMGVSERADEWPVPKSWANKAIVGTHSRAIDAWHKAGKPPYADNMADFTEFLLKSPYLGHSEGQTARELAEAYPLRGIDGLLNIGPINDQPYVMSSFEHYSAPWVVDRIRHELGFEFPVATHFKAILRKVAL